MSVSKAVILLLFATQLRADDLSVRLTPSTIRMGTFYAGAQVRVDGECARDAKVIVVIKGNEVAESFNVKGRVGPIWVNTGKVRTSGVPSLFLLFSPEPASNFLRPDAVEKYNLDLASLKKQLRIEPKSMDQDLIRSNYIKLKLGEDTYRLMNGAVKMGEAGANGAPFAIEFQWPKKAPPGTYEVSVYECRSGEVTRELHTPLAVAEVGFPAFMASLARDHASLYGVLAVIVTMIAGFGIDFIVASFRRKKRIAPVSAPQAARSLSPGKPPQPSAIPGSGSPPPRPRSAA